MIYIKKGYASRIGKPRGPYKLVKVNAGYFKDQGKTKIISCLVCKKTKKVATCYNRKFCSLSCYYKSRLGAKRPEHSEFMKKAHASKALFLNNSKIALRNRIVTQAEREVISQRIKLRWADKNDYLNSRKYRQLLSDFAISLKQRGMFNHMGHEKYRQGTYDINGKKYYFRSLWEVNYALYLDFLIKQGQIIKWEYEVDTFWFEKIKRGVRSYLPDFKVFNDDGSVEYHEVKGWMDPRSITRMNRMKKYYPKIKLILIDKVFYKDMIKKLGRIIGAYE